jgi:hypothetical protein
MSTHATIQKAGLQNKADTLKASAIDQQNEKNKNQSKKGAPVSGKLFKPLASHPTDTPPGDNKKPVIAFNSIPLFSSSNLSVQTKLTINTPGDKFEQEADIMAERFVQMDSKASLKASTPITPVVQRKCSHCDEDEKKQQVQRKESATSHPQVNNSMHGYLNGLHNSGTSLSQQARRYFEPRFGYDFSKVRIHTDANAAKSARSINALAYTSANHIVFGNGQYNPQTNTGKKLLGHELTHVIQQTRMQRNFVARKEGEQDGADISLGYLDNDIVGAGAEEIVGKTQWLVLKEFMRGFLAGVKFMPDEQKQRIQKKFTEQGFVDTVKYTGGYALGIIEGIGKSIYGLVEAVITLIKLPYEISKFLAVTFPDLAAKYGPRIVAFMTEGGGLEQKMKNAVSKFMKNPRENLKQIQAILDSIGNMALAKVRELGKSVAAQTMAFLEEPWFQYGRDVGKVVGQILFEVILAVASDAIANVVKEALTIVGRLSARLVAGAVELVRSAGRLVGEALEWLSKLGSKVAGEMGEMFEAIRAFLTKMKALIMELGQEAAVADTGIAGNIPVPKAGSTVLESRAVQPPVRTSPAKVSDLTPPKVHPSNVPKEAPAPKREPFASDEDFHKGFDENSRAPGAKGEALEDLQEGNKGIQDRSAQGTGLFNIDKHHVFPQEERAWFTRRRMTGADDIDNFTVQLDKAAHQAQHGGGDWQLARRQWADEYNKLVMRELRAAEKAKAVKLGKPRTLLTPTEIKEVVFELMKKRGIPQEFVPYK